MRKNNIKHWIVVGVMCGLAAASIGICQNTPGVFYTAVSEDLGILRGTFALHATLSMLAIALTALQIPRIMKRFSLKQMVITGAVLMTVPTAAMSRAGSIAAFYALSIIRGVGAGLVANVTISITINRWFREKNGVATSIAFSFSGLAGAVCSPLLSRCITAAGWRQAYLLQAGMLVLFCLPGILIAFRPSPEEEGLSPYGSGMETAGAARGSGAALLDASLRSLPFLALVLFTFLHTSISGLSQHLSGVAQSLGFSADTGALLLSLAMIGNIAFKLVIGILSDRTNPVKASLIMIAANAVSMALLYIGCRTTSAWMLFAGAFLFGSVYSVGAVGIALMTRYFFGQEQFAKVYPKLSFTTSLGSSSSLPIIGYIYDFTGSYISAFLIDLCIDIFNFVLIFLLAASAKKRRP